MVVIKEVVMKKLLLSLLLFSGIQILHGAAAVPSTLEQEIEKLEQSNREVQKIKAILSEDTCPVCLEEFKKPNDMWVLPQRGKACGHVYHKDCIAGWAKQKLECPKCKAQLVEDDVPPIPEEKVDLDTMTDQWNPYDGKLLLQDKNLGSVQGFNDFSRASEITGLHIGQNPIRTLPAGAFEKYINLKQLHLDDTQLRVIDENAFQGLGSLQVLTLSGLGLGREDNSLRITAPTMAPLHSLKELGVCENNLKTLPQWTQSLRKLKTLSLGANQLELTEDTFNLFSELRELNLDENQLRDLPEGIFRNIPLTRLNLSGNNFTALPLAVQSLSELRELDLDDNQLELTKDTFKPFSELETLYLSYNGLKSIPEGTLNDLFLLKDLFLVGNQLKSLPVGALKELPRLTCLDLVGNNFSPEEQERIRAEVVSPDCKVFFTPEDKAVGIYGLTQNVDGNWVDEYGNLYAIDEDGGLIAIGHDLEGLEEQVVNDPGFAEVDADGQVWYPMVPVDHEPAEDAWVPLVLDGDPEPEDSASDSEID